MKTMVTKMTWGLVKDIPVRSGKKVVAKEPESGWKEEAAASPVNLWLYTCSWQDVLFIESCLIHSSMVRKSYGKDE